MTRIPRIKFPQRHLAASGSTLKAEATKESVDVEKFFSRPTSSTSVGGKASDQPKRTPVTQEEIDAVMLGGCI